MNTPASTTQAQQLLELIKLYRFQEDAYFDKLKRGQFAGNEKDKMMTTRKKLDYLLITFKL